MTVETTCPYCGVGCGVTAIVEDSDLIAVSGSASHPANRGKLCVKGSNLPQALATEDRLLYPEVDGKRVSWDEAISTAASRFGQIIEQHGPDSVAFYVSGQLLTEDYYVANKLMKGCIGSANIDTNSRLCMASAVAGYKRAFGADAVPCNYEDLELADLILITGSNAAWTHPILYQRMALAKRRRGARVVLIDPRQTASAALADLQLNLKPGTDAALFNFLVDRCRLAGVCDDAYIEHHVDGAAECLAECAKWTLEHTSEYTGLPREQLQILAKWVCETPRLITFFSQGINQSSSGTDKANAIINLHLLTGRIGKPGTGPFSITGQPNAMGGREVGGLANQLAAHMALEEEADRARVQRFWKTDTIASRPGLKAVDLFEAVHSGKVRAIWIMATNPVVSLPDADRVKQALERCELVIVSDVQRSSDTLAHAHIAFPAAAWGEKDGTVTNSERRISRQRPWRKPLGEAQGDWWIITRFAHASGYGRHFPYASPADIFREHAALSAFENGGSRAFDISALTAISNTEYEDMAPVQWPVNAHCPDGTERLFGDGRYYTPNQRARCLPIVPRLPVAPISPERPIILNTGRLRDQWHTMTRTGFSTALGAHTPEPFVAMHPQDALSRHLKEGQLVTVQSQHGSCQLRLRLHEGQAPGTAFTPIHWTDDFSRQARVGALFAPFTDPVSGQPESKQTPVEIVPLDVKAAARLLTTLKVDRERLQALPYWSRFRCGSAWGYALAFATEESPRKFLDGILPTSDTCSWLQSQLNGKERIHVYQNGSLIALYETAERIAPPVNTRRWQQDWDLASQQDYGRVEDLEAEASTPICACLNVTQQQIQQAIASGADTTFALGRRLGCGTRCGSCLPELEMMIAANKSPETLPFSAPNSCEITDAASIQGTNQSKSSADC